MSLNDFHLDRATAAYRVHMHFGAPWSQSNAVDAIAGAYTACCEAAGAAPDPVAARERAALWTATFRVECERRTTEAFRAFYTRLAEQRALNIFPKE